MYVNQCIIFAAGFCLTLAFGMFNFCFNVCVYMIDELYCWISMLTHLDQFNAACNDQLIKQ